MFRRNKNTAVQTTFPVLLTVKPLRQGEGCRQQETHLPVIPRRGKSLKLQGENSGEYAVCEVVLLTATERSRLNYDWDAEIVLSPLPPRSERHTMRRTRAPYH
jgi:hypothetical protein